nr:hypothetical protein [bacterium]
MSQLQKTANFLFLASFWMFVTTILLLSGESFLLVGALSIAMAVPYLSITWAFNQAKERQGKSHGSASFFSDLDHLSRAGWKAIVISLPLGVTLAALAISFLGKDD